MYICANRPERDIASKNNVSFWFFKKCFGSTINPEQKNYKNVIHFLFKQIQFDLTACDMNKKGYFCLETIFLTIPDLGEILLL